MNLEHFKELDTFIGERLPLQKIVFIVNKKTTGKKINLILDSFGSKEKLKEYYQMFEPTNGKKATLSQIIDPLALDMSDTIALFMEGKNIRWGFALTNNAIQEVIEIAQEKNHF